MALVPDWEWNEYEPPANSSSVIETKRGGTLPLNDDFSYQLNGWVSDDCEIDIQ